MREQCLAGISLRRRGFTLVELLVVIAIVTILSSVLIAGLARVRESARRASCQSRLKQIALSLKMYSGEDSRAYFPPLMRYSSLDILPSGKEVYISPCGLPNPPNSAAPIQGTFDWPAIYPEYMSEVELSICPSDRSGYMTFLSGRWNRDTNNDGSGERGGPLDPCAITAESYGYLAWAISRRSGGDIDSFVDEFEYIDGVIDIIDRRLTEGPEVYDEDIYGSVTGQIIPRTREGIERFLVTDALSPDRDSQSSIPVMFDLVSIQIEPFNHVPEGSNVLFMDGHVDFVIYPGDFPVSTHYASVAEFLGN